MDILFPSLIDFGTLCKMFIHFSLFLLLFLSLHLCSQWWQGQLPDLQPFLQRLLEIIASMFEDCSFLMANDPDQQMVAACFNPSEKWPWFYKLLLGFLIEFITHLPACHKWQPFLKKKVDSGRFLA